MDRCVALVDAGYLFAQGGLALHGTKARQELLLDAAKFVKGLTGLIQSHCPEPILRTYWYDGAKDGVPTSSHLQVGNLPYVKLRLGRLNSQNQQKGVDALIYRDLMTLASERSITQAYLLSGDDDLREGVIYAQDRGVRVVLLGIRRGKSTSQSQELRREADEVMTFPREILEGSLLRATPPDPAEKAPLPGITAPIEDEATVEAAKRFTISWVENASLEAVSIVLASKPRIPKHLDIDLLRSVEDELKVGLKEDQQRKRTARRTFWAHLRQTADEEHNAD